MGLITFRVKSNCIEGTSLKYLQIMMIISLEVLSSDYTFNLYYIISTFFEVASNKLKAQEATASQNCLQLSCLHVAGDHLSVKYNSIENVFRL